MDDENFMGLALQQAEAACQAGEVPVCAVVE
jgi:tRNA(Arg) A34 adenosine deaminase TadA